MRLRYKPVVPRSLLDLDTLMFSEGKETTAAADIAEVKKRFPLTFGRKMLHAKKGERQAKQPLRVGVVLSGGQAAGGHNVIAGLFDALKCYHQESVLYGFLHGPIGVIEGKTTVLSEATLASYRNLGGFDLIGSGRTKVETRDQFEQALNQITRLELDGVVIIGGDDSNTNAALLAEFLLEKHCPAKVIGVPKTIDGDLQNEHVQISFGFDTACRVYSEMIGNLARDALSAKKYVHFVKLMGRSASHIALECALQTQPNLTLIGEEIAAKNQTMEQIIDEIAQFVTSALSFLWPCFDS